jgi:UDP-glucuronate 4-epimerase
MKVLITGAAGFVGSATTEYFHLKGHQVFALDSFSNYYSVVLKKMRAKNLKEKFDINVETIDLSDKDSVVKLLRFFSPNVVVHLAAQPGVRLPLEENDKYVKDNLLGFSNLALESTVHGVESFLYASSSSVYGNHPSPILTEKLHDLHPISFYGATKLANEILAGALSEVSTTKFRGLRFFTVYGPWGRPDMAYFKLINAGLNKKAFTLFGDGTKQRDFTYIDDVIHSIYELTNEINQKNSNFSDVVNVGGGKPVSMNKLISTIERELKTTINVDKLPNAQGDVNSTYASNEYLETLIGVRKFINVETGIHQTVRWALEADPENRLAKWV